MSRKPVVTAANIETLKDYYVAKRPNRYTTPALTFLIDKLLSPKVHAATEVQQRMEALLASGARLLFLSNHTSHADPVVAGAAIHRLQPTRHRVSNFTIPAHSGLFGPWPPTEQRQRGLGDKLKRAGKQAGQYLLRTIVESAGAVPIFRRKENRTIDNAQRTAANGVMFDEVIVGRVAAGSNVLIYGEGSTQGSSVDAVRTVRQGIGRIVCGVHELDEAAQVYIVPMAHVHDPGSRFKRGSDVVFGMPYEPIAAAPAGRTLEGTIAAEAQTALQATLEQAHSFANAA